MTFNHEAVASLPVGANADKAAERALLVRRYAYCLSGSESAASFVAVDPDAGTIPLYLIQNNILFAYDSTDSTTAADGTTCIVTSDGKRYKSSVLDRVYSVLTKGTTAQPVSPSVGDAYIIPTAATGTNWSGKDGKIGLYTLSGWQFLTIPTGAIIYVKDETAYYHRDVSGAWVIGMGSLPFSGSSVPASAIIGAGGTFTRRVVNQTTNTPPVSPTVGDAYVIGSAPTGAWAGNTKKLAVCESGTTFTIYTPADGARIYDTAQAAPFRWSSGTSTWISDGGFMKKQTTLFTASGTFTKDARCVMAEVFVIGEGGTTGTSGATASFGSHCSATGGANTVGGGLGGTASGGDFNISGRSQVTQTSGDVIGGSSAGKYPEYGGASASAGGAGAQSIKILLNSDLLTNEAVTVGHNSGAQNNGAVIVEQWIAT